MKKFSVLIALALLAVAGTSYAAQWPPGEPLTALPNIGQHLFVTPGFNGVVNFSSLPPGIVVTRAYDNVPAMMLINSSSDAALTRADAKVSFLDNYGNNHQKAADQSGTVFAVKQNIPMVPYFVRDQFNL